MIQLIEVLPNKADNLSVDLQSRGGNTIPYKFSDYRKRALEKYQSMLWYLPSYKLHFVLHQVFPDCIYFSFF